MQLKSPKSKKQYEPSPSVQLMSALLQQQQQVTEAWIVLARRARVLHMLARVETEKQYKISSDDARTIDPTLSPSLVETSSHCVFCMPTSKRGSQCFFAFCSAYVTTHGWTDEEPFLSPLMPAKHRPRGSFLAYGQWSSSNGGNTSLPATADCFPEITPWNDA